MNGIYETDYTFDFNKLMLISPTTIAGGNYFIKFRINNSPLYIQPPKCKTRQGIIKSGKKMFCDLMFTNENETFIQWMENLELHCRKIIYQNKNTWFETELDEHDIENTFTSPLKLYKSGKCYLLRTSVPHYLGECTLAVYNEEEEEVGIQEIQEDVDVNTILEIQGIRCSPRSFLVDIEIKQMMCIRPKNIFKKCLFKKDNREIQVEKVNYTKTEEEKEDIHEPYSDRDRDPKEDLNKEIESTTNDTSASASTSSYDLYEPVEIDLDVIPETEVITIKNKKDIYYQMYRDAKKKAKLARDLALSSYLEAKKIKNTYMLNDLDDSDSDLDESFEDSIEDSEE